VADDIRSARLYRVLPKHSTARRPVFIVYPSRRHLAPRTRAVLDFLIEQFRLMQIRLAEERIRGENDDAWLA
jgi:DNA-binding transcriptional LysR family regulator